MRTLLIAMTLAAMPFLASGLSAQEADPAARETPAGEGANYDAIQATIDRMQRRIEQMGKAAAERDEMLNFLEEQIERAAGRISGGEETQEALRQRAATLGVELQALSQEREALSDAVDERAALVANLEEQIAHLTELLAGERRLITTLESDLGERETALEATEAERATLQTTLEEREAALRARERALAEAETRLRASQAALERERATRSGLETRLGELEREQAASQDAHAAEQAALRSTLGERETALGVANERIALLNAQLTQLNRQLGIVETLLDTSESQIAEQQATIASLGRRLEQALIDRVEELSQYRSEFFGRLRQILGDRPEIRIVGDRFVFQSELLFASGSSRLDPAGTEQLRALAMTLREVADTIPPEIGWILQVDGHTDRLPVRQGGPFASNWELSTARAISVVEFLIGQGIPPERLAATGFGEFQPLDTRDDEIAYRRNRRIEFKLTSS